MIRGWPHRTRPRDLAAGGIGTSPDSPRFSSAAAHAPRYLTSDCDLSPLTSTSDP